MKSKQKGMTLIGFLFILAIGGFFAYMAMKLFPPYYHYSGVVRGLKELSAENLSGKSHNQIRHDLMYKLDFQYAGEGIAPSDLHFEQKNGVTMLRIAYNERIHFIYNIDFLIHFEKSSPLSGSIE